MLPSNDPGNQDSNALPTAPQLNTSVSKEISPRYIFGVILQIVGILLPILFSFFTFEYPINVDLIGFHPTDLLIPITLLIISIVGLSLFYTGSIIAPNLTSLVISYILALVSLIPGLSFFLIILHFPTAWILTMLQIKIVPLMSPEDINPYAQGMYYLFLGSLLLFSIGLTLLRGKEKSATIFLILAGLSFVIPLIYSYFLGVLL